MSKLLTPLMAAIVLGAAVTVAGSLAKAEPVQLKLANAFPALDAQLASWSGTVSDASDGLLDIAFYGTATELGKDQLAQLERVKDGTVDIAIVITNYHPSDFPDDDLAQLPGLFQTATEGSMTVWRLYQQGFLRGYEDFAVLTIGTSASSFLHTNFPVTALDVLDGKQIRVGTTLLTPLPDKLGARPVFMPIAEVRERFGDGSIDGVITVPVALFSGSRISEVARHHLMEPLGQFTIALLMNKQRYQGLTAEARNVLDAYSGEALARLWGERADEDYRRALADIVRMPGHVVRSVALDEQDRWAAATRSVSDVWVEMDPHHAKVLEAARGQLITLGTLR